MKKQTKGALNTSTQLHKCLPNINVNQQMELNIFEKIELSLMKKWEAV